MQMNEPLKIAIIGAGEMGLQALHYLSIAKNQNETEFVGWLDDTKPQGSKVKGYKVLGGIENAINLFECGIFNRLFIAIGYQHLAFKNQLIRRLKGKVPLINIIAPQTYIDPTAKIGCNIMIYPGAIIDKNVSIHDGVTLNLGTVISHDSEIGACSFMAPQACIAGFSHIGECCFLGIGTRVIDNLSICNNVQTGAGSVVITNILEAGLYIGVPAKKHIKKTKQI